MGGSPESVITEWVMIWFSLKADGTHHFVGRVKNCKFFFGGNSNCWSSFQLGIWSYRHFPPLPSPSPEVQHFKGMELGWHGLLKGKLRDKIHFGGDDCPRLEMCYMQLAWNATKGQSKNLFRDILSWELWFSQLPVWWDMFSRSLEGFAIVTYHTNLPLFLGKKMSLDPWSWRGFRYLGVTCPGLCDVSVVTKCWELMSIIGFPLEVYLWCVQIWESLSEISGLTDNISELWFQGWSLVLDLISESNLATSPFIWVACTFPEN